MRQRKSKEKHSIPTSPTTNDPNRIVLQLDESLCVVNEILSTPATDTDCLSEHHELELDDVTKFLENDQDISIKKSIPVLDRMKSFASGVFLQPRGGAGLTSNEGRMQDAVDTCNDVSFVGRGGDEVERNVNVDTAEGHKSEGGESVETPYHDFALSVGKESVLQSKEEDAPTTTPNKTEEQQPQYEFRNVSVSIQVKELIGITRITRKKFNFQDAEVTAVVSYQGNSIDNNESIFVDCTSLPLVFDEGKKSKGFARWDCEESELSMINFSRSVTKPLKRDNYVDHDPASSNEGDKEKGFEVNEEAAKLPTVSDTFAPEIVSLQVSLQYANESLPIGVVTIIIPWDHQDADVNVPVVQSCTGVAVKKKKLFAMGSSAYVTFANDNDTKYKMEESASLRIRLKVSPGKPGSNQLASPVGQINKDNQQWQKLGASSSKLTLYQRLQLFSVLRKQQEYPQPKADKDTASRTGSRSSKSSTSGASKELDAAEVSLDESRGYSTGQGLSPIYSLKSQLSVMTEASSAPLLELNVDDIELESKGQLSEISDSDSSCVTGSSGGTLTHSLYSSFSLNQRKGSEMTENVIKFFTCDPTLFFRTSESEEEKDMESSDSGSSNDDSSASSGSTITTTHDEVVKDQVLSFDTHVYKLPLDESIDVEEEEDIDIDGIARLMTFDTPVRKLP